VRSSAALPRRLSPARRQGRRLCAQSTVELTRDVPSTTPRCCEGSEDSCCPRHASDMGADHAAPRPRQKPQPRAIDELRAERCTASREVARPVYRPRDDRCSLWSGRRVRAAAPGRFSERVVLEPAAPSLERVHARRGEPVAIPERNWSTCASPPATGCQGAGRSPPYCSRQRRHRALVSGARLDRSTRTRPGSAPSANRVERPMFTLSIGPRLPAWIAERLARSRQSAPAKY